jgi:small subunit ribosomal protein S17
MGTKILVGTVVSSKVEKSPLPSRTKIVAVRTSFVHKKYKKIYIRTKRYTVHDHLGSSQVGQRVKIRKIAPTSKTKRWALVNILEKG